MGTAEVSTKEEAMLGVKQAVSAATTYAREIFGSAKALTLEEVEKSPDGRYWMITLGIDEKLSQIEVLGGIRPRRDYKIFKVDAASGEVLSMKIRPTE
jgi:hypothetical protein